MPAVTGCLDNDTIDAFVHHRADVAQRARVEAHLASCAECRACVIQLAGPGVDSLAATIAEPAASAASLMLPTSLGRFGLERRLGTGAMGTVYAAHDPVLQRKVAVKVMHRHAPEHLTREGQAIAQLSHPNVVAIYDLYLSGQGFIAMELVEGMTLRDWMATPRHWRDVVRVIADVGQGLSAAHRLGLVHHDVKPANVLISREGVAKIGDFGLADDTALGGLAEGNAPTQTHSLIGTPAYMAPEQFEGAPASAATDQFGLCIVLYEALYGVRPWRGATLTELAHNVRSTPLRLPTAPRLPRHVRKALQRGLARLPQERFPSIAALVEALQPSARRTVRYLAGALAFTALGAGALIYNARTNIPPDACEILAAADSPWRVVSRASVQQGLTPQSATHPNGVPTHQLLSELDERIADLATMRRKICRDHRAGNMTSAMATVRSACLDNHRVELVAVTFALSQGEAALGPQPMELVRQLDYPSACDRVTAMRAPTHFASPIQHAASLNLRRSLASANTVHLRPFPVGGLRA